MMEIILKKIKNLKHQVIVEDTKSVMKRKRM